MKTFLTVLIVFILLLSASTFTKTKANLKHYFEGFNSKAVITFDEFYSYTKLNEEDFKKLMIEKGYIPLANKENIACKEGDSSSGATYGVFTMDNETTGEFVEYFKCKQDNTPQFIKIRRVDALVSSGARLSTPAYRFQPIDTFTVKGESSAGMPYGTVHEVFENPFFVMDIITHVPPAPARMFWEVSLKRK